MKERTPHEFVQTQVRSVHKTQHSKAEMADSDGRDGEKREIAFSVRILMCLALERHRPTGIELCSMTIIYHGMREICLSRDFPLFLLLLWQEPLHDGILRQ